MPYIDPSASARVRAEREARGLSPEALAREIRDLAMREGWKIGAVHGFTIRRIEGNSKRFGLIPGIRVKCVIGLYFGIPHQEIWRDENKVFVQSEQRMVAA